MRLFALLAVLVFGFSATDGLPQDTCAEDAQACDDVGQAVGQSMVQARQKVDNLKSELQNRASAAHRDATSIAHKAAVQLRRSLSTPSGISGALSGAMAAINQAITLFQSGRIAEGFQTLGDGILNSLTTTLTEDVTQSPMFIDFTEKWNQVSADLPGLAESATAVIEAYAEEATPETLLSAIGECVKVYEEACSPFLDEETGPVVTQYMGAVEDVIDGLERSFQAYADGDTGEAVNAVWEGVRDASTGLLPEDLQNDANFLAITGALDGIFGELSANVLRYQQRLLNTQVCWRRSLVRERVRPSLCPDEHYYEGTQWCYPGTIGSGSSLLETSVKWKGGGTPGGAVPALCDQSTDFKHKHGGWCYKPCRPGTESHGDKRCRSTCMGRFPVSSALGRMCGATGMAIFGAYAEIAVSTVRGVLSLQVIMNQTGDVGEQLTDTSGVLVDVALSWVYPLCPLSEE